MKNILLIIMLFSFFSIAHGQRFEGISAGINFSTLHNEGKEYDVYSVLPGLRIGGVFAISFSENFKFNTGLAYSTAGAKLKESDYYVRLHNLSTPFLLAYSPGKWIAVEAGPEINFLLNVTTNFPPSSGDYASIFDHFDYGLNLGVEVRAMKKIGLSLRNYFGLKYHSEIHYVDEDATEFFSVKSDRSNVTTLSVNYYFGD